MNKELITFEGKTDDLLTVSQDDTIEMKNTRLLYFGDDKMNEDSEILDILITSTNIKGKHPIFDKMIGKEIKVIIELVDDIN